MRSNDKLFLGAVEDDFLIDGYTIRRYVDLKKVKIEGGKLIDIHRKEGHINNIVTPDIDTSDWRTVFTSLKNMNINIIVERESNSDEDDFFYIGRINKVSDKAVLMYHFDADGIWEESPVRVPYAEITSVSFGMRYVDIFSKHIDDPPGYKD